MYNVLWYSHDTKDHCDTKICESSRQQADPGGTQVKPDAAVAVEDFNHAAELKCQGRALTFPGNPTPCPLSAGEQRTQKGAGQGELCHRDEGRGEEQRKEGWCRGGGHNGERVLWGGGRAEETESDFEKKDKKGGLRWRFESDQWWKGRGGQVEVWK